jgi:putative tricarboxylic transport membrane protein
MEKTSLLTRFDAWIDGMGRKMEGKKISIHPNLVGPALFVVFSVWMMAIMPSQIVVSEEGAINAQTFPKLLLSIMLVLSAVILVVEIVKLVLKKPCDKVEIELLTEVRALLIVGMFVLYLVLLKPIGFIFSSILFACLMTAYFRVKRISYYLIGAVSAILIGVLFQYVLHVRLP